MKSSASEPGLSYLLHILMIVQVGAIFEKILPTKNV